MSWPRGRAKIFFLISSFSEAASITICTSRSMPGCVDATMRARPACALSAGRRPRLTRVRVGLVDVGQPAVDRVGVYIAQNDGNAARAEPLGDAGAHEAGADDGGVRDLFRHGVAEEPLRYFSARKKLRIRFWVASVAPSSVMASTSIASDCVDRGRRRCVE